VQAGRHASHGIVQQPIDERVHILIAGFDLHSGRNRTTHGIEALLKFRGLIRCQYAGLRQGSGPRLGKLDIKWPETKIDADRPIDSLKFRGWSASEPATPEFMRDGTVGV
jgi:hypothetical protein